jgi:hypothetical protein
MSRTQRVVEPRAKAPKPIHPSDALRVEADALYRTADEWVRQRERYSNLVESAAPDDEQAAAEQMIDICRDLLAARMGVFEAAASALPKDGGEEWRRAANTLWMAAREYLRRQDGCDTAHREIRERSPAKLNALGLENDLAASALLALQQAIEQYRRVSPTADHEHLQRPTSGARSKA